MSTSRIIATTIGVGASTVAGYGMYRLMLIGSCTGDGCDTSIWVFVVALLFAVISAMVGDTLLLIATLLAGLGIGAVLGPLTDPNGQWVGYIIGATLVLSSLATVLVGRATRKAMAGMRAAIRDSLPAVTPDTLQTTGRAAVAEVLAVRETGTTVNDNPVVGLRVRMTPTDGGTPVEGEKNALVSRLNIPRVGERFAAGYDPGSPDSFVLILAVTDHTPAHLREVYERVRPEATPGSDLLERLGKLNELRLAGALTEAEFERQKAKLLDPTG
ncbi:low affinity Fe/Cu permease [Actinoplanes tereljensis]|uniref:SHOCT domain-containing protein n=1 Tax=Paractinoplanes tereljensis TaxID=571912 RepID=UPI0019450C84|nr:SHOCT domain-containing protein [Actinoplanes tereljensis]